MTREKMADIKAQEQALSVKDKKRQRKERTHRLIKNGELAEKYLNCPDIDPAEFEKLLQALAKERGGN